MEIHWKIISSEYPIHIDMKRLWSRAQPVTLAQAPTLSLSPEDLMLHLCLHAATHLPDMKIRMLCDIGEVVRLHGADMDWSLIASEAKLWGIGRSVYINLRLAQELLEVSVPVDRLSSLRPEDFDESHLNFVRNCFTGGLYDVSLLRSSNIALMYETKGFGRKLAMICKRTLLPRKMMALIYPAPADSWRIYLYYPVRIKELLLLNGAVLWQLAKRDTKTREAAVRTNQLSQLKNWLLSG